MYSITKLITTIVVFIFLFSLSVCGQEYYLDIRNIPGEVTVPAYEDQICITSFSWGVRHEASSTVGGGGGASAANAAEFKFGKSLDRASPLLFGAVANGERFPELTFTIARTGEMGTFVEAIYVLTNVTFTGFQPGGEVDSGQTKEVISLVAEEVKISHFRQDPDGSPGDETIFTWDFATNTGG